MAVLFKGQVEIMINRHRFMGDGISISFPDDIHIFVNTGNKYTLQIGMARPTTEEQRKLGAGEWTESKIIGMDYETVADAYIAAQVHLGKLELKDGMYVPTEPKV